MNLSRIDLGNVLDCVQNPSKCSIHGITPDGITTEDLSKKFEETITNEIEKNIGEDERKLLNDIKDALKLLEILLNPDQWLREAKQSIIYNAQESAIEYLEVETQQYENDIYKLSPLVIISLDNSTVNVIVLIYLTNPNVDTTRIRDREEMKRNSYAVLYTDFNFDISNSLDLKQIQQAIQIPRFELYVDTMQQVMAGNIQQTITDIILNLVPQRLSVLFEVFDKVRILR
ncbi:hypothetical protein FC676_11715 [Bacillus cereus]|uniref:hypothetical protein n=1 Tax=Bacillus cereus TaxID=1396 RepID=UPI0010BF2A29|nr:hypothetical protein [Bacillus cereus]TKH73467.1 hypothetical protein FC676_11715 [Bacillus cereus]